MKTFSTNSENKMSKNTYYQQFYDYYGDFNYADKWVSAALAGTAMSFTSGKHGPNNFAALGDAARIEAVKKGTAYMNVWMYAIGEFEDALDDCERCTPDACSDSCTDERPTNAGAGSAFYDPLFGCKDASTKDLSKTSGYLRNFPFEIFCRYIGERNLEFCQQSCANEGFNYVQPLPCCTTIPSFKCNEHAGSTVSVHAWDEGVAFYTGSLEGTAYGGSSDGKLLYRLAEKRCENFGTCGAGISMVNSELGMLFAYGRDLLQMGSCSAVRPVINQIVSLMTVPLVQGALRYAYKNSGDAMGASPKNAAEGATFAAAVLPLVHACNTMSASTVSTNLKFGLYPDGVTVDTTRYSDFAAVKSAFEDVYACLGITCAHVGGLMNGADPYAGAAACTFQSAPMAGYVPGSSVADHNMIDLDQKEMMTALKAADWPTATKWYATGGSSPSKGSFRTPACAQAVASPLRHASRSAGRLGRLASGLRLDRPTHPPRSSTAAAALTLPAAAIVGVSRHPVPCSPSPPRTPFIMQARSRASRLVRRARCTRAAPAARTSTTSSSTTTTATSTTPTSGCRRRSLART